MKLSVADNNSNKLGPFLCGAIEKSQDVRIAVAFVSDAGIDIIRNSIDNNLLNYGTIEFLVGLDINATEPKALQSIFELQKSNERMKLYCYASLEPASIYHPKLYLCKNKNDIIAIIGSSNLTEGGLHKNIEINIIIEANDADEIISDIYDTYNRLKFHPKRVIPDQEFLDLYSYLWSVENKRERIKSEDRNYQDLRKSFQKKVESLQRPKPSSRDLVGWLKMVYERLPENDFSNEQIYYFEKELQEKYPENQNIRAKIRQQLQVLRDMGLIKHLGRSRWKKCND